MEPKNREGRLTTRVCLPSPRLDGRYTNRPPRAAGRSGRPSSVQRASASVAVKTRVASRSRPITESAAGPVAPRSGAAARAARTTPPARITSAPAPIARPRRGSLNGRRVSCGARPPASSSTFSSHRLRMTRPAARSSAALAARSALASLMGSLRSIGVPASLAAQRVSIARPAAAACGSLECASLAPQCDSSSLRPASMGDGQ